MFKKRKIENNDSHTQDIPFVEEKNPELPPEPLALDARFYTKEYQLTEEDKQALCELIAKQEFRAFERYIDWRVNAAAHRMVAAENDERAGEIRAEIRALVKIGNDMRAFWTQMKKLELAKGEIELETKKKKKPKLYGDDGISVLFKDEAI